MIKERYGFLKERYGFLKERYGFLNERYGFLKERYRLSPEHSEKIHEIVSGLELCTSRIPHPLPSI